MNQNETDTLEVQLQRYERARRRVYIAVALLVSAALVCAWLVRAPWDIHRTISTPIFIVLLLGIAGAIWRGRMPLARVETLLLVTVCAMPLSRQIWLYFLADPSGQQWLRLLGNTYWATSGVLVLGFTIGDRRHGLVAGASVVLMSAAIAAIGLGTEFGWGDMPANAIPYAVGSLLFLVLFLAAMGVVTIMRDQWHSAISRAAVYSRWALTDKLTGLANRRAGTDVLTREFAAAKRHERPLSVIMGDLDGFKQVNDTAGHAVGDAVLTSVAGILLATVREADAVTRWGGEEFLIIATDSDLEGARILAERCRRAIEAGPIAGVRMTMTFGVAQYVRGDSQESLLARADTNLYAGKDADRNRVEAGAHPTLGEASLPEAES